MENKLNIAAAGVEILGITLMLLNLIGIFSGFFIGSLVFFLGIIALMNKEKKIYCYINILIGVITIISPIMIILIVRPFS